MEVKRKYKVTEIGEIPVDWEVKTLGEVTTIVSGGTPSKIMDEYWNNGNILWATPTDITKNKAKYIKNTNLKISEKGLNESSASLLPEGSILMTSRATIGEKSINLKPMATNQGFKSFICKEYLFNEYLYYYIDLLKPIFLSKASGSTFLEISKKSTEAQIIALPPLKEQQKIAEILSTVDKQIEQTDQLIEKTKELKKGLMQQLLTKGIGHTEFKQSELGEIPIDWIIEKLEKTAHILDGKRKPIKKNDRIPGDIPYYGATGIIDRVNNYLFNETLILVGEDGENLNSRVLPMAFKISGKTWINNHAHVLKPIKNINIDYLTYFLESVNYSIYITGSAQPKLNQEQLRKILILIPPFLEQQKIAGILSAVDEDIEGYEEEKVKYEELKKGLMQQLLTGKTRVKVD